MGNGGSGFGGTYALETARSRMAYGITPAKWVYPFGYSLKPRRFERSLTASRSATKPPSPVTAVSVPWKASHVSCTLPCLTPITTKRNGVEVRDQLMDFEKTDALKPGDSQISTMTVDLSEPVPSNKAKTVDRSG